MTRLVLQDAASNALSTTVTPGFASRNRAPLYRVSKVYSGLPALAKVSTVRFSSFGSAEFEEWFKFEDYVSGFNKIEFLLSDLAAGGIEALTSKTLPLTKYSMRIYFKMDVEQLVSGGYPNVVAFANGSTVTWSYKLSSWKFVDALIRNTKPTIFNGAGNGIVGGDASQPSGFLVTTGNAPLFATQAEQNTYSCGTTAVRLELQVDSARTPKVVARIYNADSTSVRPRLTLTANPTDVSMDRFYIGDDNLSGYTQHMYVSQIELHDDYNLGGQYSHSSDTGTTPASVSAVGTPVRRPKYEVFRLDRELGVLEPIELVGTLNRTAGNIDTSTADMKINDMDYRYEKPTTYLREHWFLGEEEEDANPFEYSPGNASTASGIIWPDPDDNPMPSGGYPLVLWAHSGFFVSGSYRELDRGWLFHWLNRGYAVASVGYSKSALDLASPYDPGQGQYPTWIHDYKMCAMYLATKGMSGDMTYPINTNKMIFTGYSAGGFIALGAMASRELSDDGSGRDLRARTSTRYSWNLTYGSVPDPEPLACIVYGAPTDMQIAVDNDPTHPDWGSIMRVTVKAFSGNSQDVAYSDSMLTNTSIPNMISRNGSRLKPVMYVQGGSDYLVVAEHETALADAFATYAPGVLYRKKVADGVVHDRLADQFNWNHVNAFLADVPGL